MMLVIALSASISFSSCGSDDDDTPGGGGSTTSGGGASATSMPGSYTGITRDNTRTLTAIFAEDGTGIINDNGKQYPLTYSMGGDVGIAKVKEKTDTYTYTIKFIEGFMLFENLDGDIIYYFYKSGHNLGSPNPKKIIGSWGNQTVFYEDSYPYRKRIYTVNCTFNSDGKGILEESETYPDYPEDNREWAHTLTYKMENAYVAKGTISYGIDDTESMAFIVLNNKVYIYGTMTDHEWILSKK